MWSMCYQGQETIRSLRKVRKITDQLNIYQDYKDFRDGITQIKQERLPRKTDHMFNLLLINNSTILLPTDMSEAQHGMKN